MKYFGPLIEISRLQNELNRLFQTFMEMDAPGFGAAAGRWSPSIDIVQCERSLKVMIELPGVRTEDIGIAIRGQLLTISGVKRRGTEPTQQMHFVCMERYFGAFLVKVPINEPVNTHSGEAKFANGVLCVTFRRVADKRDRQIEIPILIETGESGDRTE